MSFLYSKIGPFVVVSILSLLASGCLRCEEDWTFNAFRLTLADSVTGEPVCDAAVTAEQDGEPVEVAVFDCTYIGPEEQDGSFNIRIVHPDYAMTQIGFEVGALDRCHVDTEERHLVLIPKDGM